MADELTELKDIQILSIWIKKKNDSPTRVYTLVRSDWSFKFKLKYRSCWQTEKRDNLFSCKFFLQGHVLIIIFNLGLL